MDVSKQAREAIEAVYGSEQQALEAVAQQAKEGDFRALKLILSYAYGTPIKNTEITIMEDTDEPMVRVSKYMSWMDRFRDPESAQAYEDHYQDVKKKHDDWKEGN